MQDTMQLVYKSEEWDAGSGLQPELKRLGSINRAKLSFA